jgi:hypothetical protein
MGGSGGSNVRIEGRAGERRLGSDWLRGWRAVLLLFAAAFAGTLFAFAPVIWLLPAAQTLLAWPVLWLELRAGRPGAGARLMLVWACMSSLCMIAFTVAFPHPAELAVFRGIAYREEMFTWIRTNVGAEGTPSQFVPQHFLHYALTLALSTVTAGLGGLLLGTLLLNYMNFYVGSLILHGTRPVLGALFGWPIWSMVRVAGFVLGACAMAHLGLARGIHASPWNGREWRRLLLWSVAFFLADMAIKAALAPYWRKILMRALVP